MRQSIYFPTNSPPPHSCVIQARLSDFRRFASGRLGDVPASFCKVT